MKPLPFFDAARNPRRPAVIIPVQQTESAALAEECARIAGSGHADVIEWRIDPLVAAVGQASSESESSAGAAEDGVPVDADAVAEAVISLAPHVTGAGLPVLITLRSGFEGGVCDVSEDDYAEVVRRVAAARVAPAVDVEIARTHARELIDAAHAHGESVVASRHNFASTDGVQEMLETLTGMAEAGADVVKIAMMPTSPTDVADLLRATAEADADLDRPVLGISMGRMGRASRILGGDFGSCATFAQMGEASAPGQVDAAELATMLDSLYG